MANLNNKRLRLPFLASSILLLFWSGLIWGHSKQETIVPAKRKAQAKIWWEF